MLERKHGLPIEAYQGQVVAFYTCCFLPQNANLCELQFFSNLIKSLETTSLRYKCTVPIITLMPNHFHTIIRGTCDESDTRQVLVSAKINIGRWLMRNRPDIRLQKDFYDEVIGDFKGWSEQALYVFENPVRAGLVKSGLEWPFTACIGHRLTEVVSRH